jgi:hypothetical protein
MRPIGILLALLGIAAVSGFGKSAAPAFEVATIKPAPPITPENRRSLHLGVKIDGAMADIGGLSRPQFSDCGPGLAE